MVTFESGNRLFQAPRESHGYSRMAWISKTDYVLWCECAKNAWLKLHRPEVYYAAELTEFEQAVIDAGIEVEGVARGLFPDSILVTRSKMELQASPQDLFPNNFVSMAPEMLQYRQHLHCKQEAP
jgi:hypothetical protein